MKKTLFLLLALLMVFTVCGCAAKTPETPESTQLPESTEEAEPETTPAATPAPIDLPRVSVEDYVKVDGSTANLPLAISLMALATGCTYEEAEAATVFSGTDPAYYALGADECDMLVVYEAAQSTKTDLEAYAGFDIQPIGKDALVFVVNEDNPVESLTVQQLHDIYTGKITNWKELGGNDQEIVAFQRPVVSGSGTLMEKYVMKGDPLQEAPTDMIAYGMDDIINEVSSYNADANAIGYSVYYYAKNMFAQPGLKFLAVEGVLPTNETIKSGEYGFINEFVCVLPASPKPYCVTLRDFLLSDAGQEFIEGCDYVPMR